VRGNHDLHDRAGFFKAAIDLTEGEVRSLGNDLFIAGLGWMGEQFFDLPGETHLIDRCQRIEDEWSRRGVRGQLILMTHYPPHDPAVLPYMGSRDGFFFDCVRNLIEDTKPLLVIAGHSHVQFGRVATICGTTVLFPGRTGRLVTVDAGAKSFEIGEVRHGEAAR